MHRDNGYGLGKEDPKESWVEQATNKAPRDPQIADFQKKKRKKGIVGVKLTVHDSRTFGNSSLEAIPMSTQPPTSAYTGYPLGHLATDQNLKPFSNITASATPPLSKLCIHHDIIGCQSSQKGINSCPTVSQELPEQIKETTHLKATQPLTIVP